MALSWPETHPHVERAAAALAGLQVLEQKTLDARSSIFKQPTAGEQLVEMLPRLGAAHLVHDVEVDIVGVKGQRRLYYFLHVGRLVLLYLFREQAAVIPEHKIYTLRWAPVNNSKLLN